LPLGKVSYRLLGALPIVSVDNSGSFGRFGIDDVVGPLTCAPEPRLLHLKAYLHALTSVFLPDPLTSRTGIEEALHVLGSAICQPWGGLSNNQLQMLYVIAELSPQKWYYPDALKIMERVVWHDQLPWWAQHGSFRPTVQQRIVSKVKDLTRFAVQRSAKAQQQQQQQQQKATKSGSNLDDDLPNLPEIAELRQRGQRRRARFEPDGFGALVLGHAEARRTYTSRFFGRHQSCRGIRGILHVLKACQ